MSLLNIPYRIEKPLYNCQMAISINTEWRRVPLFLHEMKRVNLSIYKARMHDNWTTVHINSNDPKTNALVYKSHLENVVSGKVILDTTPLHNSGLHPNTKINIYNISNCPYTIVDFSCIDRTGLFCEILEFFTPYDVNVENANCTAVKSIATNIFFITNRNHQKLSSKHIEFLNNVFEYDLKRRIDNEISI